jgi:hypothetical protein
VVAFTVVAFIAAASTVECAQEWRLALVLLLSALQRSALQRRALITGQVITELPLRWVVHTVTITMHPMAAACLRRNGGNIGGPRTSRGPSNLNELYLV